MSYIVRAILLLLLWYVTLVATTFSLAMKWPDSRSIFLFFACLIAVVVLVSAAAVGLSILVLR